MFNRFKEFSQVKYLLLYSGSVYPINLKTEAASFVKEKMRYYFIGNNPEDRAIVDQWLEYRTTVIDRLSSKGDLLIALRVSLMPSKKKIGTRKKTYIKLCTRISLISWVLNPQV